MLHLTSRSYLSPAAPQGCRPRRGGRIRALRTIQLERETVQERSTRLARDRSIRKFVERRRAIKQATLARQAARRGFAAATAAVRLALVPTIREQAAGELDDEHAPTDELFARLKRKWAASSPGNAGIERRPLVRHCVDSAVFSDGKLMDVDEVLFEDVVMEDASSDMYSSIGTLMRSSVPSIASSHTSISTTLNDPSPSSTFLDPTSTSLDMPTSPAMNSQNKITTLPAFASSFSIELPESSSQPPTWLPICLQLAVLPTTLEVVDARVNRSHNAADTTESEGLWGRQCAEDAGSKISKTIYNENEGTSAGDFELKDSIKIEANGEDATRSYLDLDRTPQNSKVAVLRDTTVALATPTKTWVTRFRARTTMPALATRSHRRSLSSPLSPCLALQPSCPATHNSPVSTMPKGEPLCAKYYEISHCTTPLYPVTSSINSQTHGVSSSSANGLCTVPVSPSSNKENYTPTSPSDNSKKLSTTPPGSPTFTGAFEGRNALIPPSLEPFNVASTTPEGSPTVVDTDFDLRVATITDLLTALTLRPPGNNQVHSIDHSTTSDSFQNISLGRPSNPVARYIEDTHSFVQETSLCSSPLALDVTDNHPLHQHSFVSTKSVDDRLASALSPPSGRKTMRSHETIDAIIVKPSSDHPLGFSLSPSPSATSTPAPLANRRPVSVYPPEKEDISLSAAGTTPSYVERFVAGVVAPQIRLIPSDQSPMGGTFGASDVISAERTPQSVLRFMGSITGRHLQPVSSPRSVAAIGLYSSGSSRSLMSLGELGSASFETHADDIAYPLDNGLSLWSQATPSSACPEEDPFRSPSPLLSPFIDSARGSQLQEPNQSLSFLGSAFARVRRVLGSFSPLPGASHDPIRPSLISLPPSTSIEYTDVSASPRPHVLAAAKSRMPLIDTPSPVLSLIRPRANTIPWDQEASFQHEASLLQIPQHTPANRSVSPNPFVSISSPVASAPYSLHVVTPDQRRYGWHMANMAFLSGWTADGAPTPTRPVNHQSSNLAAPALRPLPRSPLLDAIVASRPDFGVFAFSPYRQPLMVSWFEDYLSRRQ